MADEVKEKKHRKSRLIDPNAPKRPTSNFNFFMKYKSTEYINNNPGVPLCDVIKIMSADWHKMSKEDRKPFEEAAEEAKRDYDKKVEEYRKTEDYRNFMNLKESGKSGRSSDVISPKKSSSALKDTKKKPLAVNKLPFDVFTKEFKDFNRKREDEYRKIRRTVNDMEEELENVEERLEALNSQKAALKAEQNEKTTIERQSNRAMERYRQTILSSSSLKELLRLSNDSDVSSIMAALKDAQKQPHINEQVKKHIAELKFN